MASWSVDKIVAVGLVAMGGLSILGYIAHIITTGNSNGTEIPMAIVSGLTGYIGRGAVQSAQQPSKTGERPLEKVASTATAAQKALDAAESIRDIVKK